MFRDIGVIGAFSVLPLATYGTLAPGSIYSNTPFGCGSRQRQTAPTRTPSYIPEHWQKTTYRDQRRSSSDDSKEVEDESDMSSFTYTLFNCFDDPKLCLITFFCPCYVNGKTAEAVGDNCLVCSLAYIFTGCIAGGLVRAQVRAKKDIEGSACGDLMVNLFCPLCALVQSYREVCGIPYEQAMVRV